ncbi:zinc-binding alcohol dehydrogenase [Halomicroarcula sp. GCM10025709]|uniref:zinc-dependent alcohol dehydrogenase n=1 Tax=Haloarcula TaxID=2237 RepID=UPI0024C35A21|nr:zinc-binding alcohol dehydrogenase [Halomicroarcula sp. YJ-61-S]
MTDTARTLYFDRPGSVSVRERRRPAPDADEVLVETTVSGVSPGTELLVYNGEVPEEMAVDETIDTFEGTFEYPITYGYAAVGRVVETGAEIDPSWRGRTVFAFNPHESHFCAPPDALYEVPAGMEPATATLFPTAETAVNFVLDGAPRVGERAVVFGAGPIGLATTAVLSSFPLSSLTVVDPVEARRDLASALGATETATPEGIEETTGPAGPGPAGFDLAVEASGNPVALDAAIEQVGYDGRVVVGSWYGTKPAELDLGGHFHRGRVDLLSSQVSTLSPELRGRWSKARRMDRAVETVRHHDLDRLISHRIPFADAPIAYEMLAAERDVLSTVFTYGEQGN